MSKTTNHHGIPEAFERFDEKNAHSREGAEFSVTELIDAPQISYLKKKHDDEIEEDVSTKIMSILGTAVHAILQHGAAEGDVAERRFHAEINGHTVSGAVDLLTPAAYEDGEVTTKYDMKDYKTVRGAAMVINPNGQESWNKQLNCYDYLATENGFSINDLEVVAIVRDWTAALVRRDAKFPRQAVVRVPIPKWTHDEQKNFLEERMRLHTKETPDPCTDEERWKGGKTFAVTKYLKDGGLAQRAWRLFDSSSAAELHIMENGLHAEVVVRESVPTRCMGNYCGVSQFCNQYMNE